MLLVRFGQMNHVIIDRAYLKCLSHDQGQEETYNNILHIYLSDKYYIK